MLKSLHSPSLPRPMRAQQALTAALDYRPNSKRDLDLEAQKDVDEKIVIDMDKRKKKKSWGLKQKKTRISCFCKLRHIINPQYQALYMCSLILSLFITYCFFV